MKLGIFLIVWGSLVTALLIVGLWAESVLGVIQGGVIKPGELVASIILYSIFGPLILWLGVRRVRRQKSARRDKMVTEKVLNVGAK
jgi:hypothetical protein